MQLATLILSGVACVTSVSTLVIVLVSGKRAHKDIIKTKANVNRALDKMKQSLLVVSDEFKL